jgi:acetyl-CoA carboxylase biotin carboxyl carrier protein
MPSPKPAAAKATAPNISGDIDAQGIDTKLVRKLADILSETGLTEIEVAQGELKIRVSRGGVAAPAAPVTYHAAPAVAHASASSAEVPAAAPATAMPAGEQIKSPMVGTIYLQPQPEAPSFVKVGDKVTEGQTLLIIEAMKTMNPVPAPRAGKVVAVLVGDGQAVEFGEPLVVIE